MCLFCSLLSVSLWVCNGHLKPASDCLPKPATFHSSPSPFTTTFSCQFFRPKFAVTLDCFYAFIQHISFTSKHVSSPFQEFSDSDHFPSTSSVITWIQAHTSLPWTTASILLTSLHACTFASPVCVWHKS